MISLRLFVINVPNPHLLAATTNPYIEINAIDVARGLSQIHELLPHNTAHPQKKCIYWMHIVARRISCMSFLWANEGSFKLNVLHSQVLRLFYLKKKKKTGPKTWSANKFFQCNKQTEFDALNSTTLYPLWRYEIILKFVEMSLM